MADPNAVNPFIPAIVGFVGVIVGSIISTTANLLLAVRKEMAEERAREWGYNVESQKALRIVDAELMTAESIVTTLRQTEKWPSRDFEIAIPAWTTYRDVLCRISSDTTWNELVMTVFFLSAFNQILVDNRANKGREVKEEDLNRAEGLLRHISDARKHIAELRK